MTARVLLVDDDIQVLELLAMGLEAHGLCTSKATSAEEALRRLQEEQLEVDVVVTDYQMSGMSGVDLGSWVRENRATPTILLTGHSSLDVAVAALRAGLYDFQQKPVEPEVLFHAVERAARMVKLERELETLRQEQGPSPGGLIGESSPMLKVIDRVRRVAGADVSVLITGETGTGKDVVARSLHSLSHRQEGPFVAINCAAIPESLLESELFGHVAGAFTGAQTDKRGLFVQADGGTLFLDEIGEMPLDMQAKLLRALQDQRVRPVGATEEAGFDARVIAATNRDLEEQVEEGTFREDLYYRLDVVHVALPPLRARGLDVLLLADYFLHRVVSKLDRPVNGIAQSAATLLMKYRWPGNVRELESAIQHAVALTQTSEIVENDLPDKIREQPQSGRSNLPNDSALPERLPSLEELEREHIERVLAACDRNKTRAARILGLDRRTLYRKLERMGLGNDDG